MAVLSPVRLTITNYEGEEELDFDINQADENAGTRKVKFGKHLFIESTDFSLDPPPKYFRLKKGGYVRLKNAYIVRCDDVVTDKTATYAKFCAHTSPKATAATTRAASRSRGSSTG